jgi:serine/threonine protein kinase
MAKAARYSVLRKIADGGMAEIYLGTQHGAEGFARPIVIKRIRAGLAADLESRNMLIDEAHVAMSLSHGGIAQVLDLGTCGGSYFLVLELVDGWDLAELLYRATLNGLPLPTELALHVVIEACRALAYAHTRRIDGKLQQIVHRDVSPHNILISEQGEVKLTDFGIAIAPGRRVHTVTGMVKGKLGYMSPEQARGETLDPRSDIFAVGILLYLMTTGQKPYVGTDELDMLEKMRRCEFIPPRAACPTLPLPIADIIHRAMQMEPSRRYQSAEELLVEAERVQRTCFTPAGQTELKRWLARLSERDGVLPTSLRPPVPGDENSLREGSALVLEEVAPIPLREVVGERRSRHWSWLGIVAVVILVVQAVGVGWLLHWYLAPKGASSPAALEAIAGPDAAAPAAQTDASGAPEAAATPPPDAEAPPPDDGGEPARGAASPAPDAAAVAGKRGTDAGAPAAAAVTAADEVVSVRLVSAPSGATVFVSKQSFGSTPVNVRFKPELTYDLSFQKSGYKVLEKRVYVPRRAGQVVQVVLDPD